MKRAHIGAGIVGVLLMAAAASLSAHHTVASLFDTKKLVMLTGTITEVEWKNPHVFLHLNTNGDAGRTTAWTVETLGPQGLSVAGLKQDSFTVGKTVSMTVCIRKDGEPMALTYAFATPAGTTYARVGGC